MAGVGGRSPSGGAQPLTSAPAVRSWQPLGCPVVRSYGHGGIDSEKKIGRQVEEITSITLFNRQNPQFFLPEDRFGDFSAVRTPKQQQQQQQQNPSKKPPRPPKAEILDFGAGGPFLRLFGGPEGEKRR